MKHVDVYEHAKLTAGRPFRIVKTEIGVWNLCVAHVTCFISDIFLPPVLKRA